MRALLVSTLLVGAAAFAACTDSNDTNTQPGGGDEGAGGVTTSMPVPPGGGGGGGGGTIDPNVKQDYDDVATAIGANVHAAMLPPMTGAIDLSYGRVSTGWTEGTPGQLATGTGTLTGTVNAISYTLTYECHTPDHIVIPCNGAEDHVRLVVDWSGTAGDTTDAMTGMTQKGVWYVRSIPTATPWVGGKGNTSFQSQLATGTYTVAFSDASDHFAFDPTTPALPSEGADALTLNVNRTGRANVADRTFDINATLDIDGTDEGRLTLDGVMVYEIQLSTGFVTPEQ